MRSLIISPIVCGVMALAGCTALTRTPYQAPTVALPGRFEHSQVPGALPPSDAWWRALGEPQLNDWIDLALERNGDLAAAGLRVRRAALEARLAGNALAPTLSGSLAVGATRALSGETTRDAGTASAELGISWEIDLFGRLGAQRDAARFQAQASAEDRDAVLLSLIASTASIYWQLGFANERIASAQQSLAYGNRTRDLINAQFRAGTISRLERREADQTVAEQEALLSQLVQTRNELRQALTILFDGASPPGSEPQRLPTAMPAPIGAGLPAELLGRRPDLRAAELRLRSALAHSDAIAASYYPRLSLTADLGTSSSSLLNVLANPAATLGANMTLHFLNVREMRLSSAIAKARYEEAVVMFRKSLYTALSEVERALSARTQLLLQEAARRQARDEAAEVERLYEARFRAGLVPLRAWLDAQERQRSSAMVHASTHLALLQNHLTIHQVLGGGIFFCPPSSIQSDFSSCLGTDTTAPGPVTGR